MRNWNVPCQALSDFYTEEALEYLRGKERIAVMPSYLDNSPLTVMECLLNGVPFLASDAGGTPEMIHPEDRMQVLCPPQAERFAQAFLRVIERGIAPARLAFDLEANRRRWTAWHAAAAASLTSQVDEGPANAPPYISVCLTHCDRPVLLAQALASLRAQSYRNYEVILVDDASGSREARAQLVALEAEFAGRGWRLLRLESRLGPGVARNRAAAIAKGEYLLFMDDDNLAKAHELETLARVAARRRKEIYVCAADVFSGMGTPTEDTVPERRMLPLGSCGGLGFFECRFGDTNSLVRRDWFLARGGFDERHDVAEDWLFLARTALDSIEIEVIPLALYWYRRTPNTRQDGGSRYRKDQSLLRIYQDYLPVDLRGPLAVLLGKTRHGEEAWRRACQAPMAPGASGSPSVEAAAARPNHIVFAAGSPTLWHNTGRILGEHVLCHRHVHQAGHCVFGPGFRPRGDGPVHVGFHLEGLAIDASNDTHVSLDIYDQASQTILAIRHLSADELKSGGKSFSLTAEGDLGQQLEFRVYWHGNCDILVSTIEVDSPGDLP
jgi:GT2 family glycosyltransferase